MPIVKEGSLTFHFPNSWRAAKLDEWSFYRNPFVKLSSGLRQPCGKCGAELRCGECGTAKTEGLKAVDILAQNADEVLWLLEVKDYRQSPRTKVIDLADEVALKMRDSLAVLVAAATNANDPAEGSFARAGVRGTSLRVGLHLAQPRKHSKLFPRAIDPAKVQQRLKQLIRSIDPHPRVFDIGGATPWTVTEEETRSHKSTERHDPRRPRCWSAASGGHGSPLLSRRGP